MGEAVDFSENKYLLTKRVRVLFIFIKLFMSILRTLKENLVLEAQISIETFDHYFRFVGKSEAQKMLGVVAGSFDVWIFIFEPNDLLSDTNKGTLSVMGLV